MTRSEIRRRAIRRRKLALLKEKISGCVAGFGFLLMLGAAGGSDLGTMSAGAMFFWCVAGLLLMAAGLYGAHAFYGQEHKAEWLRDYRRRYGAERW